MDQRKSEENEGNPGLLTVLIVNCLITHDAMRINKSILYTEGKSKQNRDLKHCNILRVSSVRFKDNNYELGVLDHERHLSQFSYNFEWPKIDVVIVMVLSSMNHLASFQACCYFVWTTQSSLNSR